MVASDRVWLAGKEIFLQNGFVEIDQSPPSFQLLVNRFDSGPLPVLPKDWESRQAKFGAGLSVIRTPQCPYIEDAVQKAIEAAEERGIPVRVVEYHSAQEVQEHSPTPYGVFGIVRDGRLLSYYYVLPKDFDKVLSATP
jgi:hypothetical protein